MFLVAVHHNQLWEQWKVLNNKRMHKENMGCIYQGILLSHKEKNEIGWNWRSSVTLSEKSSSKGQIPHVLAHVEPSPKVIWVMVVIMTSHECI
jgi:hypothetical protein